MIKTMSVAEVKASYGEIVTNLEIESGCGNILVIHSNYDSYSDGKIAHNKYSYTEPVYLEVTDTQDGSQGFIGLSLEEVKAIIKTLQSVVDFIELDADAIICEKVNYSDNNC